MTNINQHEKSRRNNLNKQTYGHLTQEKQQYDKLVSYAIELSRAECEWQFRLERWNCSLSSVAGVDRPIQSEQQKRRSQRSPKNTNDGINLLAVSTGAINSFDLLGSAHPVQAAPVREAAFVNALTSAAVVHTLASACVNRKLATCSKSACQSKRPSKLSQQDNSSGNSKQPQSIQWITCMDGVDLAFKYAENLSNSAINSDSLIASRYGIDKSIVETKRKLAAHNYLVGRRAVVRMSSIACSCQQSMQTQTQTQTTNPNSTATCPQLLCTRRLPAFRAVGEYLKAKYLQATHLNNKTPTSVQQTNNYTNIIDFEDNSKYTDSDKNKQRQRFKRQDNNRDNNTNGTESKLETNSDDLLLYIDETPDICALENSFANGRKQRKARDLAKKLSLNGTSGRRCIAKIDGLAGGKTKRKLSIEEQALSCKTLCCSREFVVVERSVEVACNKCSKTIHNSTIPMMNQNCLQQCKRKSSISVCK